MPNLGLEIKRKCGICGKMFIIKTLDSIYCSKKYHVDESSVWAHVRKYSIPSRQIGSYVYVPKEDIDNLYKSEE